MKRAEKTTERRPKVQRKPAPAPPVQARANEAAPRTLEGHVLGLQRAAGNSAVTGLLQNGHPALLPAAALQREPTTAAPPQQSGGDAAAAMAEQAMQQDVETIVGLLKQQTLWPADESQIVDIFQRRLDSDRQAVGHGGPEGTPLLDKFIRMLKRKTLVRATARSAWQDTTVNAWDTLFHELEDDRLARFQLLAAQSKNFSGPESGPSENFWGTLGEQEAIGMFGAFKGLSTGAAGVLDLGAWAITKQANMVLDPLSKATGVDMTLEAPKIAAAVGEGFDFMGDEMFGKEKFSQGEQLYPGFNAAQIGDLGGKIIWTLTMMGAGGQADAAGAGGAQAKALLTAIDILGKVKSVEDQATSMIAFIEKRKKENKLSWAQLQNDNEFHEECIKLAAAIAGAVALGTGEKSVAAKIGSWLKAPEIAVKVARVIELMQDGKKEEAGKIIGELIAEGFNLVGGLAAEQDKKNAEAAKAKEAAGASGEVEVLASEGAGEKSGEPAPKQLPSDAPPELESTLETLGGLQGAVEQSQRQDAIDLPPDSPMELQTALESSNDLQAAFEGQTSEAAIELPPEQPLQLQSAAESTGDLQQEWQQDPRARAQAGRAEPFARGQQPRRWLLTREDELNYVQYSPQVNKEARFRTAYRFTPPPGGGTVRFGPREYTYDANGNLVGATTTQLTLGVRDPVMYGGSPRPGTDYAHLLGVDFGTIDAQVGRHGGAAGDPAMNRPLGEVDPLWYSAERRTLDRALDLQEAGRPFRVVAEARGHDAQGVPAETRLRLESNGQIVEDSGWIANAASANRPASTGQ